MARHLIVMIVLSSLILLPSVSFASCMIDDVVSMARGGAGSKIIEEKCAGEVDDAPRCAFKTIVSLAIGKKGKSTIAGQCERCDRPICQSDANLDWSCALSSQAIKGRAEGDTCGCRVPNGYFQGTILCD